MPSATNRDKSWSERDSGIPPPILPVWVKIVPVFHVVFLIVYHEIGKIANTYMLSLSIIKMYSNSRCLSAFQVEHQNILYTKKPCNPNCYKVFAGGDRGIRTPVLLHAKQALSQLSYTPMKNNPKSTLLSIAQTGRNVNRYTKKNKNFRMPCCCKDFIQIAVTAYYKFKKIPFPVCCFFSGGRNWLRCLLNQSRRRNKVCKEERGLCKKIPLPSIGKGKITFLY